MTRTPFAPLPSGMTRKLVYRQMFVDDEDGGDSFMGRNDLCFCGSQQKIKRCHPDVNETSLHAQLLAEYDKLEKNIQSAKERSPLDFSCAEGCSQCCKEYFYSSPFEYLMIKYYLETHGADMVRVIQQSRAILSMLEEVSPQEFAKLNSECHISSAYNDKEYISKLAYCPILDSNQRCSAYPVRPYICSLYGTSSSFQLQCKNVRSGTSIITTANLPAIKVSKRLFELLDQAIVNEIPTAIRPYPLFWFFANDFKYVQMYQDFSTLPQDVFQNKYGPLLMRANTLK